LGEDSSHHRLISAAYANSSWNKIISALNVFELFCNLKKLPNTFPINESTLSSFIEWGTFEKGISPYTITAYISHLKLIHKLRNLDISGCTSFMCKTQIRGAQNLQFYKTNHPSIKKVMTIPLLRILGHALAESNWSQNSKLLVWAAYTMAFFGSFRPGELLAKTQKDSKNFEMLLWSDISFIDSTSIQIHNKVPKNRTKNGEYISLFPFPYHGCCPIKAIAELKATSKNKGKTSPVFMFDSGKCLTISMLNKLLILHLEPHIGIDAFFYSSKSFRAALPSALASNPSLSNDTSIKRWGRWNSNAFERYTRLSHNAKRKLFTKFLHALKD
jgi:hypothetical protein